MLPHQCYHHQRRNPSSLYERFLTAVVAREVAQRSRAVQLSFFLVACAQLGQDSHHAGLDLSSFKT